MMDMFDKKFVITKSDRENKQIKLLVGLQNFKISIDYQQKYDKYMFSVGHLTKDVLRPSSYGIQIYIQGTEGKLKKTILSESEHKIVKENSIYSSYSKIMVDITSKLLFFEEQRVEIGFFIRKINNNQKVVPPTVTKIVESVCNSYSEKLWKEKLFTDFVFKVKDQEFKVHKSILAAQSFEFRILFNPLVSPGESNTAEITDISPKVFNQFLEYLYIRKLPKYDENTIDLYKAAHKYDVKELMEVCELLIAPKVCQNNAQDMLEFANLFNISSIKKSAFDIIQKTIFPDDKLSAHLEDHPSLVKSLIDAKNERDKILNEAKTKYAAELDAVKKKSLLESKKARDANSPEERFKYVTDVSRRNLWEANKTLRGAKWPGAKCPADDAKSEKTTDSWDEW